MSFTPGYISKTDLTIVEEVADAEYDPTDASTLYEDSAGTTSASIDGPVGRMEDVSGNGYHATQSTTADKPTLRQDANGRLYLEYAFGDSLDTGISSSDISAPYALPSIGGATLTYSGVSGSFSIRQTTGPISVVAGGVDDSTAEALADYYKEEADAYSSGEITNLEDHLRDQSQLEGLPGADTWDTSQVKDMRDMFKRTSVSDLSPLSGWDTSQVKDMNRMFDSTSVDDLSPLSEWDTSQVTDMAYMFFDTSVSDPSDISGWDVANVTDFSSFLANAPLDDVPTGDMLAGWIDGSPNTEGNMETGVTLSIQNADYTGMNSSGQSAVDALCSDPPNWTINGTNMPSDCS